MKQKLFKGVKWEEVKLGTSDPPFPSTPRPLAEPSENEKSAEDANLLRKYETVVNGPTTPLHPRCCIEFGVNSTLWEELEASIPSRSTIHVKAPAVRDESEQIQ